MTDTPKKKTAYKRQTADDRREALRGKFAIPEMVNVNGVDQPVPKELAAELVDWFIDGKPTSKFVQCIVRNDVVAAMREAGETAQAGLVGLIVWMMRTGPAGAWGAPSALRGWKGLMRGSKSAEHIG